MDTAQPSQAAETDPNVQLENAADAFKAFDGIDKPRDEHGKFTPKEQPEEEEAEEEEAEAEDAEADDEADDEEAEEAHPLPPSWGSDDKELWETLPPETQARIAEREGERDRGLNLKLQETANARKAAEARAAEVSAKLEQLDNVIGTVEDIYKVPEPDPRAFGYGTQQFNEPAYRVAHQQWQQAEQVLAQLNQQREVTRKEQQEAEAKAFAEWKQQVEAQFAPKLLAEVPELKETGKAEPLLRDLVSYAIQSGIPEDVFAPDAQDAITSAQILLLWKAQQYDKVRSGNAAPKPKPAGPAIKPGVSSPRSAQKAARRQKAFDRLDREGSIEAGAAVFKQFL